MAKVTASTTAPLIEEFIRGADYTINVTITNSDGTAYDLTGCKVYFTMNTSSTPPSDGTDTTAALQASVSSFSTPTTGIASINVPHSSTATLAETTYYYDIKLIDATGNQIPLGKNKVLVKDNITTKTS